MGFDKTFFEKFSDNMRDYFERFKAGFVTVTIKVAYEKEYNVNRIISCGDSLLTFAYYDSKKEKQLEKNVAERTGESTAFPALTVPYSAITWVEINPANIRPSKIKRQMGFRIAESRTS